MIIIIDGLSGLAALTLANIIKNVLLSGPSVTVARHGTVLELLYERGFSI
jgi:hypothetical protein